MLGKAQTKQKSLKMQNFQPTVKPTNRPTAHPSAHSNRPTAPLEGLGASSPAPSSTFRRKKSDKPARCSREGWTKLCRSVPRGQAKRFQRRSCSSCFFWQKEVFWVFEFVFKRNSVGVFLYPCCVVSFELLLDGKASRKRFRKGLEKRRLPSRDLILKWIEKTMAERN